MNEFEKKAIKMLGKEEREKIVGAATENDALSREQCENLKNALNKYEQTNIIGSDAKYGGTPPPTSRCLIIAYGARIPDTNLKKETPET